MMNNILNFIKNLFKPNTKPIPAPEPTPEPQPIINPITSQKAPIKSKLDLWCEAIKQMEGAKSSRNNPGNLRYIGQAMAVNDHGFCKFPTYQDGYDALKNLLINACTGKSKVYHSDMTLYQFQCIYSPSSDKNNPLEYATFVANKIGVTIDTPIKNLVETLPT